MRISLAAASIFIAALGSISAAQDTNSGSTSTPRQGKSKVVIERSTESAPQATMTPSPAPQTGSIAATDSERKAVTYTGYDLDVRLRPAEHELAVRALLTLRNDGTTPLAHVALQLSSSLNWERIRIQGKDAPYQVASLKSDTDHTGQLHEAVISPPEPIAPGKQLQLDVLYSGKIELTHQRFAAVHMPDDMANQADWDRISPEFVGLRGFGNVVWYPVTAVPAFLGDSSKLFDLIGEQKLRQSSAQFRMNVMLEYLGSAPNIAILNGHVVPIEVPASTASPDVPQIATLHLDSGPLGFAVPTLFVAAREEQFSTALHVYSRAETASNAQSYTTAATMVTPFLKEWLGPNQRVPATIVDLPEAGDMPFELGSVVLVSLAQAPPEELATGISHLLAHTWFQSPREWLDEGVAHFMDTLWTEHQKGRDGALSVLEGSRRALTLEEPASPQDGPGQPLLMANSPVYYRTKAAYVLWMLRDMVGDDVLAATLRAYRASEDTEPDSFEKLLERNAKGKDLHWFFNDWIYSDHGLPDFSISGVYTNTASLAGSYIVAVDIANEGWSSAEIPITVRSQKTSITERVVLPAHEKLVHRIVIQGEPTEVEVNDGVVPEVQAGIHVRQVDHPEGQE
jgi:hypothetical protein